MQILMTVYVFNNIYIIYIDRYTLHRYTIQKRRNASIQQGCIRVFSHLVQGSERGSRDFWPICEHSKRSQCIVNTNWPGLT